MGGCAASSVGMFLFFPFYTHTESLCFVFSMIILLYYFCYNLSGLHITKTCPCNKQGFFSLVKFENFIRKNWIFFLFLLKT